MPTLNLLTGEIYPARREDYITKIAAVCAKRGEHPLWDKCLDDVTGRDKELQAYLKRVCGYCISPLTKEHVLFFLYGTGANGKSVFIDTIAAMMGDYAAVAPMEMFMETHGDRHPTEFAMLRGVRLVVAQEVERGRHWAESKIKMLTGGSPVRARFMRQDFFEYTPQFKLVIVGNHKPSLRSVDEAIRRRIHLVPFTVTIPAAERDKDLRDKLKPEWPMILQWVIGGWFEYQKLGLAPPPAVRDATDAYLAEEDAFARWVEECCEVGKNLWGVGSELWKSWKEWADSNKERVGSQKAFSQMMETRGYQPDRTETKRGFIGIDLQPSVRERVEKAYSER
jgi:putative DNA primase/helicase